MYYFEIAVRGQNSSKNGANQWPTPFYRVKIEFNPAYLERCEFNTGIAQFPQFRFLQFLIYSGL